MCASTPLRLQSHSISGDLYPLACLLPPCPLPEQKPLPKRPRTEYELITRSEIWDSDGNVVLQVQNTQFHVHWSVLARHSSVFRDMQGLPQPDGQPSVDRCLVMEIYDDPQDARSDVFPACSKFHCYQLGVLPFPVVRAFIRLGRKYDFEDFFDSAVASLGSHYPTSIEAYDAEPPQTRIEWYSALHFDIINLATENNIWSALPCAYYSVLGRFSLVNPEVRGPGTSDRLTEKSLCRSRKTR
ncbi:hypothetical protein B0H14DRAFT_2524835 [Mycena olivaceomarginata]|nr:hypothetical protein B0H14DRAFT_2524835 [Mycena olivaceomarginata]